MGTGTGDTRPRPCSSRSSMGGYFTGTGTSIYSSKLVIRTHELFPQISLHVKNHSHGRIFAGMVRGDGSRGWFTGT